MNLLKKILICKCTYPPSLQITQLQEVPIRGPETPHEKKKKAFSISQVDYNGPEHQILLFHFSLLAFPEAHLRGVKNQSPQGEQRWRKEKENQLTTVPLPTVSVWDKNCINLQGRISKLAKSWQFLDNCPGLQILIIETRLLLQITKRLLYFL